MYRQQQSEIANRKHDRVCLGQRSSRLQILALARKIVKDSQRFFSRLKAQGVLHKFFSAKDLSQSTDFNDFSASASLHSTCKVSTTERVLSLSFCIVVLELPVLLMLIPIAGAGEDKKLQTPWPGLGNTTRPTANASMR
jgi:hypothetical protein